MPKGKGLTWFNDKTMDAFPRQAEIGFLIILQLHIHTGQLAQHGRTVPFNKGRQRFLFPVLCKAYRGNEIPQIPQHDLLFHRYMVAKGTQLAEKFPCHY